MTEKHTKTKEKIIQKPWLGISFVLVMGPALECGQYTQQVSNAHSFLVRGGTLSPFPFSGLALCFSSSCLN